eukprot:SAG31_NODE_8267_length_1485_cov_1.215729_1_plen_115_part_00
MILKPDFDGAGDQKTAPTLKDSTLDGKPIATASAVLLFRAALWRLHAKQVLRERHIIQLLSDDPESFLIVLMLSLLALLFCWRRRRHTIDCDEPGEQPTAPPTDGERATAAQTE